MEVQAGNVVKEGCEASLPTQALFGRVQVVAQYHWEAVGVIGNSCRREGYKIC